MSLTPISHLEPISARETTQAGGGSSDGFARVLSGLLGTASGTDAQASQAIQDLATGQAEDVHTVALAVAQADLSFRLALEIRNRLQEAYQEVIRIQV